MVMIRLQNKDSGIALIDNVFNIEGFNLKLLKECSIKLKDYELLKKIKLINLIPDFQ